MKSIEIKDNQVKVYAWNDNGNYVGSLGSLYSESEDRNSIALWSEYGDRVLIGYNDLDDSNTKKAVIRFDPEDIENGNPPWIRNTVSGTIFPKNSGGGIVVENGFVKSWNLSTVSGTLSVITGLNWNSDGITKVTRANVVIKNGLIEDWTNSTTEY